MSVSASVSVVSSPSSLSSVTSKVVLPGLFALASAVLTILPVLAAISETVYVAVYVLVSPTSNVVAFVFEVDEESSCGSFALS